MNRANIELHNVDCMEYLRSCEDNAFELAIVDPPYRDSNAPTKDMRKNGSMQSLAGRPNNDYWSELFRVSRNQIIWGANNFELPQWKGFVVWDKGIPFDFTMSMAEVAGLSEGLSTISKMFKLRIAGAEQRIHPTQKPVKLYEWLLDNYAKEGDRILDTHLGSGSIALACWNRRFDLVGCELDPDYFAAATKRIEKHKRQLQMF